MYGHVFIHTHMFMETKKFHHKTFSTDNQNQLIFRIQNNIPKKKKRWDTREIAKWVLAHCSKYWLSIRVLAATVADWALIPSFNMVAQKHLSLQSEGSHVLFCPLGTRYICSAHIYIYVVKLYKHKIKIQWVLKINNEIYFSMVVTILKKYIIIKMLSL